MICQKQYQTFYGSVFLQELDHDPTYLVIDLHHIHRLQMLLQILDQDLFLNQIQSHSRTDLLIRILEIYTESSHLILFLCLTFNTCECSLHFIYSIK